MLLWLCLGLFLVASSWRAHLPWFLKAALALGWALAAWAAIGAIIVMADQRQGATWLRWFPTLLPWLTVSIGLWVRGGR